MAVIVREKVNGSGEWWVFINHKGKRRSKKIGSKNAANAVKREVESRLARDDAIIQRSKSAENEVREGLCLRVQRMTKVKNLHSDMPAVYFITDGHQIKIGQSVDPNSRKIALQTGNPTPLKIIGIAPFAKEKEIQELFAHLRGQGEWFYLSHELLDYIEDLRNVEVEEIRPRVVSITDAAQYIGLATKTLRNRLGDKDNPFPVRPRYYGKKPLFEIGQLDAFIDSLERKTKGGDLSE